MAKLIKQSSIELSARQEAEIDRINSTFQAILIATRVDCGTDSLIELVKTKQGITQSPEKQRLISRLVLSFYNL